MSGLTATACVAPEPDLAAALQDMGLRARAWTPVTSLGGGTRRVSYRVVLEDGGTVKVRRVLDDAQSARTARIRTELDLPGLPPLLQQRGPIWVEAWVEGRTLTDAPADRLHLGRAAGLLASLHRVQRSTTGPLRGRRGTAPWRALTEERLQRMVAGGQLETRDAAPLRAVLRGADPGRVPYGLTHGDFAPENLVADPSGQLHVIDNESLGPGPLDLDLATTWSRWPMPSADFARFLDAYGRRAGRRPDALAWWRVVAAAKSVAVRIDHYPRSAAPSIARLRDLARSLDAARTLRRWART